MIVKLYADAKRREEKEVYAQRVAQLMDIRHCCSYLNGSKFKLKFITGLQQRHAQLQLNGLLSHQLMSECRKWKRLSGMPRKQSRRKRFSQTFTEFYPVKSYSQLVNRPSFSRLNQTQFEYTAKFKGTTEVQELQDLTFEYQNDCPLNFLKIQAT